MLLRRGPHFGNRKLFWEERIMLEKKFVRFLVCLMVALSSSATATMGADILFLTSSDPTHMPGDDALKAFMESLGHTVTYFDDGEDEAATEAAAAAADLVFMSESVGSGNVNNEITEIEIPMVITESYAWDEMGLTHGGGQAQNVVTTDIEIIDPGHYLAAGFSGTVTVLTDITGARGPARFGNGIAGDEADIIATATLADGQTYDFVFVYEKGAALAQAPADGSSPFAADIRVCLGFDEQSYVVWNENAFTLLEAGINYALGMTKPRTQARKPEPRDGALHEDTWANLSWVPGDCAESHDVYVGDNYDEVNEATHDSPVFWGNQTSTFFIVGFPGYPYPDGLVPGTTYYWRIDEVNDADPNSPWKGDIWSFSIPPKTAYDPVPADGAGLTETTVTLTWTPGFGAKLHTVYFDNDFDTVNNATVGIPRGMATYDPGPLEAEKVYYWRVDEFDGLGTYKGEVWAFTTPGAIGNPSPANGVADVSMATVLSWTAADNATSHEVYLGTDKNTVGSATSASPEYKGSKALGAESYDAGLLEANTTYYWRVDEVYAGNTVKGPVWNFTVGSHLLVDDFESYTDNDAEGEAIWQTWVDGFGIADNGAQVGNLMPPYCEQRFVHGGLQSMPLFYVNEAGVTNSEASLTLTAPRDWTAGGVADLSLWFRGDTANVAEPLYVAVSNAAGGPALMTHSDSSVAITTVWTEWVIGLQAFVDQGINLTNVDKIAIGLGSKGGAAASGSGTLYIDDIRLYRP